MKWQQHFTKYLCDDSLCGTYGRRQAAFFPDSAIWRVPLGALSAARARSATIWASRRTRDPYFEILGAPRGIMVTPSGGFDF